MPIVTISRMYAAGGSSVAAHVAHALGWPLLDDLFVEAVAHEAGVAPAEVKARDERVPTLVERVLGALALGSPEVLPTVLDTSPPISEERLLDVTRRVLEEVAATGPAVVVGRGAQCVLAGRADALHVFCHAPRQALVRRALTRMATEDAEAAGRVVDDMNRHREQYVRTHFRRDWKAVENYDLCLDTHALGMDGAAELVLLAARRKLGAEIAVAPAATSD